MGREGGELVTATEIAAYVYCPEQWRLDYGLGVKPGNQRELAAGTRQHARKAVAERVAGGLIGIGKVMIVVAVLVLGLLWLVWR
jgi:hypothetical protein